MYFENAVNNILLTVDKIAENSDNGGSVLPFIGFLMFILAVVMIFVGLVSANAAKREWNVFYAPHEIAKEDTKAKMKKGMMKGRIVYVLGILIMIASFFVK